MLLFIRRVEARRTSDRITVLGPEMEVTEMAVSPAVIATLPTGPELHLGPGSKWTTLDIQVGDARNVDWGASNAMVTR